MSCDVITTTIADIKSQKTRRPSLAPPHRWRQMVALVATQFVANIRDVTDTLPVNICYDCIVPYIGCNRTSVRHAGKRTIPKRFMRRTYDCVNRTTTTWFWWRTRISIRDRWLVVCAANCLRIVKCCDFTGGSVPTMRPKRTSDGKRMSCGPAVASLRRLRHRYGRWAKAKSKKFMLKRK